MFADSNHRFYDKIDLENIRKGGNHMLQQVIEYVVQNPDIKEKVKEGTVSLVGLSTMEQKAVLDVLSNPSKYSFTSPIQYW